MHIAIKIAVKLDLFLVLYKNSIIKETLIVGIMKNDRKSKLVQLGAETLAQSMIDLGHRYHEINDVIDRLISSQQVNAKRLEKQFLDLQKIEYDYEFESLNNIYHYLESLLLTLKHDIKDPKLGLELITKFYKCEDYLFNAQVEIDGMINDIFANNAKEVFNYYANLCEDEELIFNTILNMDISCVFWSHKYTGKSNLINLSKDSINKLIDIFSGRSNDTNESIANNFSRAIAKLAREIKNPELYEKSLIKVNGNYYEYEIAEFYFECERYDVALTKTNKIKTRDSYSESKKNNLLIKIYSKQEDEKNLKDLLFKMFNNSPSVDSLVKITDLIGKEHSDRIISDKINQILHCKQLHSYDLSFMMDLKRFDDVENYIFKNEKQLSFSVYSDMPDIAESMLIEKKYAVAILIFRKSINSILNSGQTSEYEKAAKYLIRLNTINNEVGNLQKIEPHNEFYNMIFSKYSRKRKFWSIYKTLQ
jgi:hypothetical protein